MTGEFLTSPAWFSNDELVFGVRGPDARGKPDNHLERLSLSTGRRSRFADNAVAPAVSPDGRFIAFNRIDPATDGEELVLADADMRRPRTLVKDEKLHTFSSIVFSPDGAKVAFVAIDRDRQSTLPEGPGAETLIKALGLHPTGFDVWMVDTDSARLTRVSDLADDDPSVAFSADASRLYVLGVSGLYRIDISTRATVRLPGSLSNGQIVRIPERAP